MLCRVCSLRSVVRLQAICKDLNEPAQLTELDSIMNELVGDNQISEEDFVNLMLKSQLYNF